MTTIAPTASSAGAFVQRPIRACGDRSHRVDAILEAREIGDGVGLIPGLSAADGLRLPPRRPKAQRVSR
jgi:hypothetical protein